MNQIDLKELNIQPFGQLHHEYIGYQSLTDVPKALAYSEADCDCKHFAEEQSITNLIESLRCVEGLQAQAFILGLIQQREHSDFVIDNKTGSSLKQCQSSVLQIIAYSMQSAKG